MGVVAEPLGFAFHQLRRTVPARRYTLRHSRLKVVLRHGSTDIAALTEVLVLHEYEPPALVAGVLANRRPLRVLDLGAHIGTFALWVLSKYPDAHVLSVEPEATNAAVLRACIAANQKATNWVAVEAAADTSDGSAVFRGGLGLGSHVDRTASNGDRVQTVDALALMGGFDLVKMDIEGGEWALLADPRLKDAAISAIVLEYHGRSGAEAADLLRAAGFATDSPRGKDAGMGLLWAWRPAARRDHPLG
jgi:FkbM family methyltransferase